MLTSIKKNFKIIAFTLIVSSLFMLTSKALVKPTTEFYVNDYANLLSDEVKENIMNTNKQLESQTGAQVVVVTIENLENQSLEEYATDLFRSFGIGDKEKNNGVLLLVALEERQLRIEVGYGLEGALPDGKVGRIEDEYMIPYLKENNWNEGIQNGFNRIIEILCEEYNIEIANVEATPYEGQESVMSIIFYIMLMFAIFMLCLKGNVPFIFFGGGGFSGGNFGGSGGFSGGGGSSGGGGASRGF